MRCLHFKNDVIFGVKLSGFDVNKTNLRFATLSVSYSREIRKRINIKIGICLICASYLDVPESLILPSREVRQRFKTFVIERGCARLCRHKVERSIGDRSGGLRFQIPS